MAGSCAEEAIRSELDARLHRMMPDARIIHELVVGGCRADVAAVEPCRISLFEIKSERDTLERLAEQVRSFLPASHWCCVVAARKWFDETPYKTGHPRLAWPLGGMGYDIWCHPEPVEDFPADYRWRIPPRLHLAARRPNTMSMLEILWRDELAAEAAKHRISYRSRASKTALMSEMFDLMTGREITAAVCRRLRMRSFPRADAPRCEE